MPKTRFQLIYYIIMRVSKANSQAKSALEPFFEQLHKAPIEGVFLKISPYMRWFWLQNLTTKVTVKPKKYYIQPCGFSDATTGNAFSYLTSFGKCTGYKTQSCQWISGHAISSGIQPNHHLFADWYYTTCILVNYLSTSKLQYTSTLNENREKLSSLCRLNFYLYIPVMHTRSIPSL